MVSGYKDREYTFPIKCEVYRNLQTGTLSVRAVEGEHKGLVIAHPESVHLVDCTFNVDENGRQRVIENERKNVHATVTGTLQKTQSELNDSSPITYNPYKFDSFVLEEDHTPVESAEEVFIDTSDEYVTFEGTNIV